MASAYYRACMTRMIGNAAILLAGVILIMAGLIAVSILFSAAFLVVMLRRLNPRHALPTDCGALYSS